MATTGTWYLNSGEEPQFVEGPTLRPELHSGIMRPAELPIEAGMTPAADVDPDAPWSQITRDAFMRRWVIRAVVDPHRCG